jgi:hypothetical protein
VPIWSPWRRLPTVQTPAIWRSTRPSSRSISPAARPSATGSSSNCRQAQVYAELAGVNNIVIDSTDAYAAMLRNLAFTLSLYSGQMCTTSQALFVPATGIDTDQGHKSFDDVAGDLARPSRRYSANPKSLLPYLAPCSRQTRCGASKRPSSGSLGKVILATQKGRAPRLSRRRGAHTGAASPATPTTKRRGWKSVSGRSVFSSRSPTRRRDCPFRASGHRTGRAHRRRLLDLGGGHRGDDGGHLASQVALSINLTGGVFVNQSAAFSDYHGTGGNPAANASVMPMPPLSPVASASSNAATTFKAPAMTYQNDTYLKSRPALPA